MSWTGPGPDDRGQSGELTRTCRRAFALCAANGHALDGTLLRFRPRPVISNVPLPGWLGPLSSGAMLYVGGGGREPEPGTNIRFASIYIHKHGADTAVRVAHVPGLETRRISGQTTTPWLGARGRTVGKGNRICFSWSANWEHTCWDASGKALWKTSRDLPTGTLTKAEKDTFAQGLGRANSTVRPKAWVDSFVRTMVFAEKRPQLSRIELTEDGELWVGPFIPSEFALLGRAGLGTPDEPSHWSVLGRDGRWLAGVTLPARFRMIEAGRDYVLGVSRDADDVESIQLLRLRR